MKVTFRSRPREIVAEQFNGQPIDGVCWGGERCETAEVHRVPHLHTMHGSQVVVLESGDWVVPEPDGTHYYPIKPDVMKKNYEEIGAS